MRATCERACAVVVAFTRKRCRAVGLRRAVVIRSAAEHRRRERKQNHSPHGADASPPGIGFQGSPCAALLMPNSCARCFAPAPRSSPMTCSCAPHLGCRCRTRASASPLGHDGGLPSEARCRRTINSAPSFAPDQRPISRQVPANIFSRHGCVGVIQGRLPEARSAGCPRGISELSGHRRRAAGKVRQALPSATRIARRPKPFAMRERSAASARDQRDSSRSHTTRYTGSRLPASSRISGSLGSQERAPSRRSSGVPSPADLRARGRPATIAGCTTASMMARLRWRPRRRYPRHVAATGHQPLARRLKKPALRPARVSVASCNGSRAARAGRSRDRIVEIAGRGVSRRGIQGGSDPSSAAAAPAERTAEARYAPIRARLQGSVRALGVAESSLSDATPSPRPSGPSAWPGWPNWRTRSCLGLCQLPGPIARTS